MPGEICGAIAGAGFCGAGAAAVGNVPDDAAPAAALAAIGALTCGADVGTGEAARELRRRRFDAAARESRRGLGFGNRSTLEEVIPQGSFEIGDKLAHGLSFEDAEGSGCGIADRLKFGLGCGAPRACRDCGLGFARNGSWKETIAQRRFEIGDELLKNAAELAARPEVSDARAARAQQAWATGLACHAGGAGRFGHRGQAAPGQLLRRQPEFSERFLRRLEFLRW